MQYNKCNNFYFFLFYKKTKMNALSQHIYCQILAEKMIFFLQDISTSPLSYTSFLAR